MGDQQVPMLAQAQQHQQEGNINAAINTFEAILAQEPTNADVHFEYGSFLAGLDQQRYYEKAATHMQRATNYNPQNINWLFAFGTFCCRTGKFRESVDAYQRILEQRPNLVPVLYNSGYTFKITGDLDTAIAIYKKVLSIKPEYDQAHLGLAFAYIGKGDFVNGWKEHEWNLKKQGKYAEQLRELLQTNNISGKTILLTPEGGIGDTINFVRYAQRLHEMGAFVIVAVQPPLIPLLSRCTYIDKLIPVSGPNPAHDASATLMSLPAIFADTEKTIPQNIPYIFPEAQRVAYWHEQLKNDSNFKIGICWQPDKHNDVSRLPIARRDIPLSFFHTLCATPGISVYSLQKYEGLDQLKLVPHHAKLHIFDESFDVTHGSFMDTAAVMHEMDLIISTDTAIAHLAGAMGKKIWLLLPYVTDWRWLVDRTDSPWYPTMQIFKQPHPFDWKTIMNKLYSSLLKEAQ